MSRRINPESDRLGVESPYVLRKARIADVAQLGRLINGEGRSGGFLLPRSLAELYEHIRDFIVAVAGERVVGSCSLHVMWGDLAEIRSLAVTAEFEGLGAGSALLEACAQEAYDLGIARIFTLTNIPAYFERHGFHLVEKAELSQKVFGECIRCPKFTDCDEVALVREIREAVDVPSLYPQQRVSPRT